MDARGFLARFWADRRAVAAAEMALVTPMLIILMFGSFELARYFLDEHVVVKAVRDGARYAGRLHFSDFTCATASAGAVQSIREITRTGALGGTTPRLSYWTSPATITVSVTCDTSGNYSGIYDGVAMGAPVVTVSASIPYVSLFGMVGFNTTGLALNASSESPVMGI